MEVYREKCRSNEEIFKMLHVSNSCSKIQRIFSKTTGAEKTIVNLLKGFCKSKKQNPFYQTILPQFYKPGQNLLELCKEFFIAKSILRILTGKTYRQKKLQRLQKVRIWAFQINSL